ncbi:ABC transporter ATP-binding protein [Alteromonas lipolytica]|uniref:ABC transporter n=1 Tax=Alteromonas lipolytica TaxID=1856405 RepID=A0A1E8FK86_9ALTE|nr:ABC transporter ATP-binding protein [Alteromonas lipolytica]OFI36028.1 ABC transporter [Alteromonas lipolytica]GGF71562.1 ABC transporter ATP-binding protein [Alteromonas lipolytica]
MEKQALQQASIELAAISHRFEPAGDWVIKGLSSTISQHEFVAVVGPSGCGKSTLLRMIAGLLSPADGAVEVYGHAVTAPRDDVGIVFQKPTLLPWLTVLDNVTFPLKHKYGRVSKAESEQASVLLKRAGLDGVAQRYPHQLSGGMQQRVGIVRAMLLNPDILLMDEPFSALDALTRERIGFDLLDLWQQQPKTVVFITHSISEAVLLADRVVVMSARPSSVVEDIVIDLPRPRSQQTLQHPDFAALTARVRTHIYAQVSAD